MPAVAAPTYTRGDVLMAIDHVSLSYGERVVLRDVCAEIRDVIRPLEHDATGQVICFLGPSGIGKTQLSRVIAGLQKPTSGRVLLYDGTVSPFRQRQDGLPFASKPTMMGMVGMVPQNYPLFEFATVAENLRIAGRQAGLTPAQIKATADDYVVEFDLQEHVNDYPRALSGGTRQRVAIVRQLLCAGNYLVLDEPFSGLDPLMKRKASEVIVKVANHDERNTVIIVTHDVTEGCAIADTVWMLGREKDASGRSIPGARIVKEYDLAALGLAWDPDVARRSDFLSFVADVKSEFYNLV